MCYDLFMSPQALIAFQNVLPLLYVFIYFMEIRDYHIKFKDIFKKDMEKPKVDGKYEISQESLNEYAPVKSNKGTLSSIRKLGYLLIIAGYTKFGDQILIGKLSKSYLFLIVVCHLFIIIGFFVINYKLFNDVYSNFTDKSIENTGSVSDIVAINSFIVLVPPGSKKRELAYYFMMTILSTSHLFSSLLFFKLIGF